MNNRFKIIYILHHPPLPAHLELENPEDYIEKTGSMEYIKINTFPYRVGFFRGDFHHRQAIDILKRTDKYQIECWRPYGDLINRIYSKDVDGILHRVFPSKSIHLRLLSMWIWSNHMLNELKRESKKNKILIYFMDGHSRFVRWLILKLKKEKIPIISQHGSSSFHFLKYKNLSPPIRKLNVTPLYDHLREMQALRYIDHYISGSITEEKFMKEKLRFKNVVYMTGGIDFDYFKPTNNKNSIRKELGLPLNKRIVIYVGRFNRITAIDSLIRMCKKIKNEHEEVQLLSVGGYKTDEFYQMGKDAGAIMVERTKTNLMLKYYQAADISVYPVFEQRIVNSGGFGYATAEALACGLPLISNNIIHFPGTREERDKIGMTMESEEILEKNIIYMLNNLGRFDECRRIAKKYFDVDVIMKAHLDKYEELFQKYYGHGILEGK